MVKEFKEFISQGNVMDLAVGVIIGGAFGKIVSSLVDNILMPIVGLVMGGIDFSSLAIKVGDAHIKYGIFLQNVIDFLIIAACIFLIVKALNKVKQAATKEPIDKNVEDIEETVNEEVKLLEEIRDLLKKKK